VKKFQTLLALWSRDDPEIAEQKPKHPPDNKDGDNTEVAGARGQKRKSPPDNKDDDSEDLGGQGSGHFLRPRCKGPHLSAKQRSGTAYRMKHGAHDAEPTVWGPNMTTSEIMTVFAGWRRVHKLNEEAYQARLRKMKEERHRKDDSS
jgi:hypothetical protein